MIFVIAEVGVNHNGSVTEAIRLVDEARASGANAVKFQSFLPEVLADTSSSLTDYQLRNGVKSPSQLEMLQTLSLTFDEQSHIWDHCQDVGIEFMSTPYDIASAKFLAGLGASKIKIASADIVDYPLLDEIAGLGVEVFLSTGMATLLEIDFALSRLHGVDVTLLHATSNYPASMRSLNLKALETLSAVFGRPIGFSDHSEGGQAALVALGLGARTFERHFTLDKEQAGPDHSSSSTPQEFGSYVDDLLRLSEALGTGLKVCHPDEESMRQHSRKRVFVSRPIAKGSRITTEALQGRRSSHGLRMEDLPLVLGKFAREDLYPGQPLGEQDVIWST